MYPVRARVRPQVAGDAPRPGDKWHLDEVFVKIRGVLKYLWRAVDQHGVSSTF
ncbi:DDE-type integrase/transposase/recombinase [Rhodococcus baikonurensis]|uniref:DDE-type integrase/transposase/recombinase n=1 Tax=Rhodococcus baikonurensis TaxID=172041 RepID=UPI003789A745